MTRRALSAVVLAVAVIVLSSSDVAATPSAPAPSTAATDVPLPSYEAVALYLRPPPPAAAPAVDPEEAVEAVVTQAHIYQEWSEPEVTLALVRDDPSRGDPLEPGTVNGGFSEVLGWLVVFTGGEPALRGGSLHHGSSPRSIPEPSTYECQDIFVVHAETGELLHVSQICRAG